ncbi:MAG: polymerase [Patescibacteria group bacterium]|jgi:DNA polymerase-1|nr:polymerase [Patescibacteria group bacterium]
MTKRLVLIDGMSVFYRGYYAMPGLSLPDGTPTGGVYGFASIAIEIIKKLEPDFVAVAWDKSKTATSKRKEIYPEYKAGRTRPPDDFFAQIPLLHDLLESFGWPLLEMDDYEADDIIGTISRAAKTKDVETCIVSGDYDMMQLLNGHVKVYITKKGSELLYFDADAFEVKYGINTHQFVDYKALVGDSSDNIPGVKGIGPKAAQSLLGEYETLEGIYEHIDDLKGSQKLKLVENKPNALLSRELARIYCDAPIELDWKEADIHHTDLPAVAAKLKEFEFHSLIKRLPKHMQDEADTSLYFHASDQVNLREVAWPDEVTIDGPFVLHLDGEDVWASFSDTTASHAHISQVASSFWRAIEFGTVISYDVKALYHALAAAGIRVRFSQLHDIRQAAFLLDPLRRDRSLAGLVGGELTSPINQIAAMRQVYAWQMQAFGEKPKVKDIAERFDFPLIYHLFAMEHHGIKLDATVLRTMSRELGEKYSALEQQMYQLAGGEFNIGSPAQLSDVLFTKLGLPTTGIKKGKTGYSTGQKELDKLRGLHPMIELIEQTRELAKLKNTYVDTLPEQIDESSRLHTTFNQDVAATGRLSSTGPNLQNIPIRTEAGRKIREAFVPDEGNVFVSADYSQFELRLAAVLADDREMIEDFNGDIDIHTKTASDVYGIPMEEVTKNQRRDAKVINFGVLYGMGPHALAQNTGMTFGDAKAFIDRYFELRAPIRRFIDATLEKAKTEGYVETFHGRRRPTPDVNSSNFMVREAGKRAAANMPIQGTEADLMKLAMIAVDAKIAGLGTQILQIHDSILVECPEKNAEKIGDILKQVMETIAPELPIKLKVDISVGKNWGEV